MNIFIFDFIFAKNIFERKMKIIFPVLVALSIAQTSTTTSSTAISSTVTSSTSNSATDEDSSDVVADITAFAASQGGDVGAPTTDEGDSADDTSVSDSNDGTSGSTSGSSSDSTSDSSEPPTIHRTYGPTSDDEVLETVEPVQLKWEHLSQLEDGKILIHWSDRVRFLQLKFICIFTANLSGQFSDPIEVSNTFEFETEVEAALDALNDDLPCMM